MVKFCSRHLAVTHLELDRSRQVTRDLLRRQPTRTVPGNFYYPRVPGFGGLTDPYLPLDQNTYPAPHSRQPVRPNSRAGPATHGNVKPQISNGGRDRNLLL